MICNGNLVENWSWEKHQLSFLANFFLLLHVSWSFGFLSFPFFIAWKTCKSIEELLFISYSIHSMWCGKSFVPVTLNREVLLVNFFHRWIFNVFRDPMGIFWVLSPSSKARETITKAERRRMDRSMEATKPVCQFSIPLIIFSWRVKKILNHPRSILHLIYTKKLADKIQCLGSLGISTLESISLQDK